MNIHAIPAFSDNYIWAINENADLYCVDPGDANPVLEFIKDKQVNLTSILLTHHHNDHTGGVAELLKAYPNCRVVGPKDSRIPWITEALVEHQQIKVGSLTFTIIFNPGHTSTHISFYESNLGWLFCGDTLFSAGCGRVFDGTMEQLYQSLNKFAQLPPNTEVYCAHEYTLQNLRFAKLVEPNNVDVQEHSKQLIIQSSQCSLPSTIELELKINPFLRTRITEIQDFALQHGARSKNSFEVFRALREEKDNFR